MKKYYRLLSLGRLEGLFTFKNRTWVHQTSRVISQHHCRHFQPPSPLLNSTYNRCYSQHSTAHTSDGLYHKRGSSLNYQVILKSKDVISADIVPRYKHWLSLSNLDLFVPSDKIGVFFCYKKKDDNAICPGSVVKTLKESLARVLSIFHPLTGEIVSNSQGEPEVLCNNHGVEFIHAHADVELKNLDFHNPNKSMTGKLVPEVNHGVLSVQVTELKCGAIIVSCAVDHRITDGHSLNRFLVAWAESAQLKSISNMPSFRPSILNPRHPPRYDAVFDNICVAQSSLAPLPSFQDQFHSRTYYVCAETIDYLQSEANSKGTKRSKLFSFSAFLWKLLAHRDDDNVNRTSIMGIVVDGRRFLSGNCEKTSSLFENHFGNVLSLPHGVASNDDLKAMPLNEVADMVHRFVDNATKEEHFRGLIDWIELHRPQPMHTRLYVGLKKFEGEVVVVSGGRGLPIKDMDFGWGKPDFGSYNFPWRSQAAGYVTTMPSTRKDGDWIVYMHLKQKDLDLIESMAPHVFTPLTHSYLGF